MGSISSLLLSFKVRWDITYCCSEGKSFLLQLHFHFQEIIASNWFSVENEHEQGNIGHGQDVLVRVHSECLTGDIFG